MSEGNHKNEKTKLLPLMDEFTFSPQDLGITKQELQIHFEAHHLTSDEVSEILDKIEKNRRLSLMRHSE